MEKEKVLVMGQPQGDRCGLSVSWVLRGKVDYDKLCSEWEANGLPEEHAPWEPTDTASFLSALQEFYTKDSAGRTSLYKKNILVRTMKRGRYAVVFERTVEANATSQGLGSRKVDSLKHFTIHTAYLCPTSKQPVIEFNDDNLERCPEDLHLPTHNELSRLFQKHKRILDHREFSKWISHTTTKWLQGQALLGKAGLYYIPEWRVHDWELVRDIFNKASWCDHKFRQMPAMTAEETVEWVLDQVINESITKIERIYDSLEGEDLKARGLTTKRKECEDLLERLEDYTELLDDRIDGIKEQATELKSSIALALLAQESDLD